MEAAAGDAGFGGQLSAQDLLEPLVLRQSFPAPPRESVESHQAQVRLLVRGLLRHHPPQRLGGRAVFPALLVEPRKLGEQREEQPPQPLTAALRPILVGVPR